MNEIHTYTQEVLVFVYLQTALLKDLLKTFFFLRNSGIKKNSTSSISPGV